MPERENASEVHDVQWTPEKVRRFWAWYGSGLKDEEYFTYKVGARIVQFAEQHRALGDTALDFGCGPGFLLDRLIARGHACEGVDVSQESLDRVRARLGSNPLLRGLTLSQGLPTPLPSGRYDTIFFLETIEHLLPDVLGPTLAELFRLLRPGGHLIVSTPNEEDLTANSVTCPDCGCRFHRVQHVTSFSSRSLAALLEAGGFEVATLRTTTLDPGPLSTLLNLRAKLRRKKGRNLLAVAQKPV